MSDGMDREQTRADDSFGRSAGRAPNDDLDTIIAQAVAEQADHSGSGGPMTAEHPDQPVRLGAEAPRSSRRRRGDNATLMQEIHRFAAEAPVQGPAEAAWSAPSAALEPVPPVQPLEAPARWTAEDKARFAAWPREVQESVLARHRALEADYTRKTQEAAELRRSAEPILNAVRPFEDYLRQVAPAIGQTPDQMIASLLGVEYLLRTGEPHQKAQALAQIAASYGIDLAALSRGELPAGGATQTPAPTADPRYQQLRQSFGNLEQQFAQLAQWMESEQQRQAAAELQAFAAATDPAGRPRHPHFERVRGVMSQLLRDDPALTLDAAYQMAVAPIERTIAEELHRRNEQADRQRQAALEKARKAAPVRSSATEPNGTARAKDLDSILSDAINARLS